MKRYVAVINDDVVRAGGATAAPDMFLAADVEVIALARAPLLGQGAIASSNQVSDAKYCGVCSI